MKPWHQICIHECGDPLVPIPPVIPKILPHAYISQGAPYLNEDEPFWLRGEVLNRLFAAQDALSALVDTLHISIFDAWRPISVQKFMYDMALNQECQKRGVDSVSSLEEEERKSLIDEVGKFWALPSSDPKFPPPHTTGAAIDLTLSNSEGRLLDMGSEIDDICQEAHPNYYSQFDKSSKEFIYHKRRCLLSNVMLTSGFSQHPNEWWHFSYGDQLWAWSNNYSEAIYGLSRPIESNSVTD